uniref:Uncharacterized protein n=1 Tax=Musa acuminata subsp. malaccensis TaxID=214687 RepID=A0A804K2X5_MUSAM
MPVLILYYVLVQWSESKHESWIRCF